jgi:hypothetical protein
VPHAELGEVAYQLVALVDTLDAIHGGLLEPPDINDRQEGWKPYDRTTDVLAKIEGVRQTTSTRRSHRCNARRRSPTPIWSKNFMTS